MADGSMGGPFCLSPSVFIHISLPSAVPFPDLILPPLLALPRSYHILTHLTSGLSSSSCVRCRGRESRPREPAPPPQQLARIGGGGRSSKQAAARNEAASGDKNRGYQKAFTEASNLCSEGELRGLLKGESGESGRIHRLSKMLPYFDPEYENFNQRINPPRVCIDNSTCSDCTLVKVDSMNKNGILLEVLQVLSDLDLHISKAYITSDGGWFMDVFHCVDKQGHKITDDKTIKYIEKALGPESNLLGATKGSSSPGRSVGLHSIGDHTAIELKGPDRTGLLSEIFAVLAELQCNVLAAEMWTHRTRVACVVYVNDVATGQAIGDPRRLSRIEDRLRYVLRGYGGGDALGALANFAVGPTSHVDRRLHQLMHADVDVDGAPAAAQVADGGEGGGNRPVVTVEHCVEKSYSVVNVKCRDRSKLLYDIVCTLTDMEYVVFHAAVSSEASYGVQELYIRRNDGKTLLKDEAEKVIRCLEAAISRRVCEGFTLELCGRDRVGLLSDVTRVLREHGLTVTRADVTTVGQQAMNVFYVRDPSGKPVDMKTIEGLRGEVGQTVMLNVKSVPAATAKTPEPATRMARTSFFSFGNLFAKLRA